MSFRPLRGEESLHSARCIAIGAGRFVRSLLLPIMEKLQWGTIVVQTRSSNIAQMFNDRNDGSYEMDLVNTDGTTTTQVIRSVDAAGSVGIPENRPVLMNITRRLNNLIMIAVCVTEAGLQQDSDVIQLIFELLHLRFQSHPTAYLSGVCACVCRVVSVLAPILALMPFVCLLCVFFF